ncbi:TraK domain-containing protein (plasmid) [Legionella sp. D16C41]|uniref:TraK domain-containing protein n=1 Tax=Legionella sp. D16C41 TaxID=3402688 RepID=UPI003AF52EB1
MPVKENENVTIQISKDNYNRLLFEKDKIIKLRFPQNYLNVERDDDGSVYLDALDDRPFTLFVTTKGGRHFSAMVTVSESTGETIRFFEKRTPAKKVARQEKPKDTYAEKIKSLVSATEREQAIPGFKANAIKVRPIYLKPSLKAELAFSLSDEKTVSQKFLLANRSSKPIRFDQRWFKDNKTRALLVKNEVIYPNQTIDVVRVLAVSHG